MTPLHIAVAGGAGFAAGAVNALAGGGTLISFPILVALGLPPVSANVTNTVALSPGYLGGALAQRRAIEGDSAPRLQQHRRHPPVAAAREFRAGFRWPAGNAGDRRMLDFFCFSMSDIRHYRAPLAFCGSCSALSI